MMDQVYFNDAYVYTHQMSLDLEGRLKIDVTMNASLTQYNREKFNYTNVLVMLWPGLNKIFIKKWRFSIRLY